MTDVRIWNYFKNKICLDNTPKYTIFNQNQFTLLDYSSKRTTKIQKLSTNQPIFCSPHRLQTFMAPSTIFFSPHRLQTYIAPSTIFLLTTQTANIHHTINHFFAHHTDCKHPSHHQPFFFPHHTDCKHLSYHQAFFNLKIDSLRKIQPRFFTKNKTFYKAYVKKFTNISF